MQDISLKLRVTYGSRFLDEPSDKVERRVHGSRKCGLMDCQKVKEC